MPSGGSRGEVQEAPGLTLILSEKKSQKEEKPADVHTQKPIQGLDPSLMSLENWKILIRDLFQHFCHKRVISIHCSLNVDFKNCFIFKTIQQKFVKS